MTKKLLDLGFSQEQCEKINGWSARLKKKDVDVVSELKTLIEKAKSQGMETESEGFKNTILKQWRYSARENLAREGVEFEGIFVLDSSPFLSKPAKEFPNFASLKPGEVIEELHAKRKSTWSRTLMVINKSNGKFNNHPETVWLSDKNVLSEIPLNTLVSYKAVPSSSGSLSMNEIEIKVIDKKPDISGLLPKVHGVVVFDGGAFTSSSGLNRRMWLSIRNKTGKYKLCGCWMKGESVNITTPGFLVPANVTGIERMNTIDGITEISKTDEFKEPAIEELGLQVITEMSQLYELFTEYNSSKEAGVLDKNKYFEKFNSAGDSVVAYSIPVFVKGGVVNMVLSDSDAANYILLDIGQEDFGETVIAFLSKDVVEHMDFSVGAEIIISAQVSMNVTNNSYSLAVGGARLIFGLSPDKNKEKVTEDMYKERTAPQLVSKVEKHKKKEIKEESEDEKVFEKEFDSF